MTNLNTAYQSRPMPLSGMRILAPEPRTVPHREIVAWAKQHDLPFDGSVIDAARALSEHGIVTFAR